jgi:hypothetical protein
MNNETLTTDTRCQRHEGSRWAQRVLGAGTKIRNVQPGTIGGFRFDALGKNGEWYECSAFAAPAVTK